jgi:dephospho-CoA kinase
MRLYIGLTGPLGSGKSSAAEVISSLAGARGIEVAYFSLSDEIRKEVSRQGDQLRRDALKQTAHRFRSRRGNGVWAMVVASKIRERFTMTEDTKILVFIDAIRNPGEVYELRAHFGDRFKLLGITAPPEIIRENLRRRKRDDESRRILEDEMALQNLIKSEMGAKEPGFGHNVSACLEMADWPPIHNDGSLVEFEKKVRVLAEQHILPLLAGTTSGSSSRQGV